MTGKRQFNLTCGLSEDDLSNSPTRVMVALVFWNDVHRSSEITPALWPTEGICSNEIFDGLQLIPMFVNLKSALSLRMVILYSDRDVNIRS